MAEERRAENISMPPDKKHKAGGHFENIKYTGRQSCAAATKGIQYKVQMPSKTEESSTLFSKAIIDVDP